MAHIPFPHPHMLLTRWGKKRSCPHSLIRVKARQAHHLLAMEAPGHRTFLLSPPYGARWTSSSARGMGIYLGQLNTDQAPSWKSHWGSLSPPLSALIRSVISWIIALFLVGVMSRLSGPCKNRPNWVIALASKCFSRTEKLSFVLLGAISPNSTQQQTDTKFKQNKQTNTKTHRTNRQKDTEQSQKDTEQTHTKIRQQKNKNTSRHLIQIQTKNTEETDTKNTPKIHTPTTTSYYNKSFS